MATPARLARSGLAGLRCEALRPTMPRSAASSAEERASVLSEMARGAVRASTRPRLQAPEEATRPKAFQISIKFKSPNGARARPPPTGPDTESTESPRRAERRRIFSEK